MCIPKAFFSNAIVGIVWPAVGLFLPAKTLLFLRLGVIFSSYPAPSHVRHVAMYQQHVYASYFDRVYGLIETSCVRVGQLSTQLTFAPLYVVCEKGLCRLQHTHPLARSYCEQSEFLIYKRHHIFSSTYKNVPARVPAKETYWPVPTLCNVPVWETLTEETRWPVATN